MKLRMYSIYKIYKIKRICKSSYFRMHQDKGTNKRGWGEWGGVRKGYKVGRKKTFLAGNK